jgi:integrase
VGESPTDADSLRALNPFFGDKPINEIEIIHLRMHQDLRSGKVRAHSVNRELGVLQQVLRENDQWTRLQSRYRQLKEPPSRAGQSLTADEEQRLREVAFTKPKWRVAGHCMMVMLSTTMGFGELRQLRRRDVDMVRGCVTVREGAKNSYRQRTIPLNTVALESMTWILERWKKLGGSDDEHYILPHRPRGERASHWSKTIPWILDEPTTSMHTAFRSIRNAAGLPDFRIYDCRVQAITKLLSNPDVSPQVSREIAGHISQAMQSSYSIQLFNTKKAALDALEARAPAPTEPKGRVLAFLLSPPGASFFKVITGRTSPQVCIEIVGCNVSLDKRLGAKFRDLFVRKFFSIDWSDIWVPILLPHNDSVVVGAL